MAAPTRIPVFPLPGALLFPRTRLPLHIFEPRYRAMIADAIEGEQQIGMIQPRDETAVPPLFDVGCLGRITRCENLPDGRYNIVLTGVSRFRVVGEADVPTLYRQVDASFDDFDDQREQPPLSPATRAALEIEAKRFAERHGFVVDWASVAQVDDESLVNGIAQIAPFDPVAKQALLETGALVDRAGMIIQLMQFEALDPGGHGEIDRLQ
jgi:Lon protease-like protein